MFQLGIYPNPTNGIINFNRILPPDAIVKVYDTSGREMLIEKSPNQINVSKRILYFQKFLKISH